MAVHPDVTSALDDTGRRFAFRPAAILGNSSLLATISERGEIERLFWPNMDHGQHLGELRLGLERDGRIVWLDDAPCSWEQSYADGSSVLHTTADLEGTAVEITDLVTPAEPVLVRGIRSAWATRLVSPHRSRDSTVTSGAEQGTSIPGSGETVFYLRGLALAMVLIAQDTETTLRESNGHEPTHDVVVHRAPVDGVVSGLLVGEARVVVAFGATPDEAIAYVGSGVRRPSISTSSWPSARRTDRETIALARPAQGEARIADLYARSLLVLEQSRRGRRSRTPAGRARRPRRRRARCRSGSRWRPRGRRRPRRAACRPRTGAARC